jgi:CheY-like chemotaxis protein
VRHGMPSSSPTREMSSTAEKPFRAVDAPHVLVVDDDDAVRETMAEALELEGTF